MKKVVSPDGKYEWNGETWKCVDRTVAYDKKVVIDKILKTIGIDEYGISDWFEIETLKAKFPMLAAQMGGQNGSSLFTRSTIGSSFDFTRTQRLSGSQGGRILARKASGFKNHRQTARHIQQSILNDTKARPCAFTGTRTLVECDHKDGRYTDSRISRSDSQRHSDFQPLTKPLNNIKRERCKSCAATGKRFDARKLGYPMGWAKGAEEYEGTCEGCIWHDPIAFRACLKFVPEG